MHPRVTSITQEESVVVLKSARRNAIKGRRRQSRKICFKAAQRGWQDRGPQVIPYSNASVDSGCFPRAGHGRKLKTVTDLFAGFFVLSSFAPAFHRAEAKLPSTQIIPRYPATALVARLRTIFIYSVSASKYDVPDRAQHSRRGGNTTCSEVQKCRVESGLHSFTLVDNHRTLLSRS